MRQGHQRLPRRQARRLAYVIVDRTLFPIDRVTGQRPYYSGNTSGTA
jgi:hypothetical protein